MLRRAAGLRALGLNAEWGPQGFLDPNWTETEMDAHVRRLYRDAYKGVEFARVFYRLDCQADHMRTVIRKEFDTYKNIKDPRVRRARIVYTSQVVKGVMNQWTNKANVLRLFDTTKDKHLALDLDRVRNPQNEADRLFHATVTEPTWQHVNMDVPVHQKMVMPRGTFYVEGEMAKLPGGLEGMVEEGTRKSADDVVADEMYLDNSSDELTRDVSVAQHLAVSEACGDALYSAFRKVRGSDPDDSSMEGRAHPDRTLKNFAEFAKEAGLSLPLFEDAPKGDQLRALFGRIVGSPVLSNLYMSEAFAKSFQQSCKAQDLCARAEGAPLSADGVWEERRPMLQELRSAGRLFPMRQFHQDMGARSASDKVGHFPPLNAIYALQAAHSADEVYYQKLRVLDHLLRVWPEGAAFLQEVHASQDSGEAANTKYAPRAAAWVKTQGSNPKMADVKGGSRNEVLESLSWAA